MEYRPLPRWLVLLLIVCCVLSIALKVVLAVAIPNLGYPDETFQYIEQAHRLVFERGLETWEYRIGMRSWLLPGVLAGAFDLVKLLPGISAVALPDALIVARALLMAVLSLPLIICPAIWGWRFAGPVAAVAGAVLGGFWFEMLYYGGHALSEGPSADALMLGMFLGAPGGGRIAGRFRLGAAGAILALTFFLRLPLAPAIAVAMLGLAVDGGGSNWRGLVVHSWPRALSLGIGFLIGLMVPGLLDTVTYGVPFYSLIEFYRVNIGAGVAAGFGSMPFYFTGGWVLAYWSGAAVLIGVLALVGARVFPLPLPVAAAVLITHTLIAHKEPRFAFAATPLIMASVAIGTGRTASAFVGATGWRVGDRGVAAAAAVFWLATSALLGVFGYFAPIWDVGHGMLTAMRTINRQPESCGVAVYPAHLWWLTGGYSALRAGLPLYGIDRNTTPTSAQAAAFSDIITTSEPNDTLSLPDFAAVGFQRIGCFDNGQARAPVCLWHRPGPCTIDAAPRLEAPAPPEFRDIEAAAIARRPR
jgi:GPI mannosyltransferase 3